MSADSQLKAFIDRVLRLKEEQDTIGQDIRDIYGEAKAAGYDKTVMGKLVAYLRKVDKAGASEVEEAEMIFDTYLDAYRRASGFSAIKAGPSRAHAHEEEFDPVTGEILDPKLAHTVVTGMQTETGRAALIAAVDIMIAHEEAEEHQASDDAPIVPPSPAESEAKEISASSYSRPATLAVPGGEPSIPSSDAGGEKMEGRPAARPGRPDEQSAHTDAKSGQATNTNSPETANETQERPSTNDEASPEAGPQAEASPAGTGAGTLADREGRREGEAVSADLPTNSEIASTAQGKVEATSAERETELDEPAERDCAAANTGGDHVTAQTSTAATAGALVRSAPAKSPLRPHCLNPGEQCGGYGTKHCRSCTAAMQEREVA
ncbi:GapR family DNA-binding domain-containing protein [Rhizobium sp. LC145]|uniref:GapR family DNA-binding domain-containing protein n=1 Tax=Rhizobium sp. LC145 TaxID=1120688 RepID=UPI000629EBE5|nr:GapR family DNA-binding domain-containing protein [Rhizobium sp. LC145]KKX29214.1 hypothetical protein YH62_15555 [Rhizobium sp. LC145]TKT69044.1 DUF2312 domain-containing protein [Rhizobiaceae bacterium LC148]